MLNLSLRMSLRMRFHLFLLTASALATCANPQEVELWRCRREASAAAVRAASSSTNECDADDNVEHELPILESPPSYFNWAVSARSGVAEIERLVSDEWLACLLSSPSRTQWRSLAELGCSTDGIRVPRWALKALNSKHAAAVTAAAPSAGMTSSLELTPHSESELLYVAKGVVEVAVCDQSPFLYPRGLYGYASNPFKPDFARFPLLGRGLVGCRRAMLRTGQVLLLPGGEARRALSWRVIVDTPALLRFRVIDAINRVDSLKRLALMAPYDAASAALLTVVSAYPTDMPVPRTLALSASYSAWTKAPIAADVFPGKQRRRGLKEWQEEQMWARALLEMNLPQATLVTALAKGRRLASLTFRHPKLLAATGESEIVARYAIERQRKNSASSFGDGCSSWDPDLLVRTTVNSNSVVSEQISDGTTQVEINVGGLQSNSRYSYRVALCSAFGTGPWSDWSEEVLTYGVSKPMAPDTPIAVNQSSTSIGIKWYAPQDDGGNPVTAYVVFFRQENGWYHQDYVVGKHVYQDQCSDECLTIIENLRPDCDHTVKVLAINSLGAGKLSGPSPVIRTLRNDNLDAEVFVHGAGSYKHGLYLRHHDAARQLLNSAAPHIAYASSETLGPLITVSDRANTVTVHLGPRNNAKSTSGHRRENDLLIQAWSAQHSPKQFDVHAEMVRSEPLDACAQLSNAQQVEGRIVMVVRGACPLLVKVANVHKSGGVSIVISDTGRCDKGFDERCSAGSSKSRNEGFAFTDTAERWASLHTPAVLIKQEDAKRLEVYMDLHAES